MVDSKAGVRIGLGCAVAAWGSALIGTACGGPNGAGEIVSLAAVDQALCKKLIECECGQAFAQIDLSTPLSCEGWSINDLFYTGEEGEEGYYYGYGYGYEGGEPDEPLPVSIDEGCVQRIAQRIDALDCTLQFTAGASDCRDFCYPFVGPRFAGEVCARQEECGRNLMCHRGECTDPCLVRPPAEGDQCDDDNGCGADLFCANDGGSETGVCLAYPIGGDACYFSQCAAGFDCNADDICEALTPQGDPCMGHRECVTGYCPAGRCAALPSVGQACGIDGICAPGTDCEFDDEGGGVCVALGNQCIDFLEVVLDTAIVGG